MPGLWRRWSPFINRVKALNWVDQNTTKYNESPVLFSSSINSITLHSADYGPRSTILLMLACLYSPSWYIRTRFGISNALNSIMAKELRNVSFVLHGLV